MNKYIKYLLIINLLFSSIALSEDQKTQCLKTPYTVSEKTDPTKGNIFVYKVEDFSTITATTIACLTGEEFLKHIYNMPDKAVIAVVASDHTKLLLTKWDLQTDYFTIVESGSNSKPIFIQYPEALKRIKEILISKPFPQRKDLPLILRSKLKSNFIKVTKDNIKVLVGE